MVIFRPMVKSAESEGMKGEHTTQVFAADKRLLYVTRLFNGNVTNKRHLPRHT